MKVCSIPGCGGTFKVTAGYCNKHYIRFRRYGDPLAGGTERGATHAFLEAHVNFDGDECLTWPFATDAHGCARIRDGGDNVPAYRIMCEMAHGPAPTPRHQATHTCGKGHEACINPNHLEWGTGFKNQQDRVEHGTSNRGERCAAHKLTRDEVLEIFNRLKGGERPYLLAKEYGVHDVTILDIRTGRTWAWLTGLPNPKARDRDGNLIAANDNSPERKAA